MRCRYAIVSILAGLAVVGPSGCRKDEPAPPADRDREPTTVEARAVGAESELPRSLAPAETAAIDAEHLARVQADLNEGLSYLLKSRKDDGGWGFAPGPSHPGLTAMVLKALLQHPDYTYDSPAVSKGFACLMKYRQPDGGFYDPEEGEQTYVTSVAVMALAAAKNPRFAQIQLEAVKFLRGLQLAPNAKTASGEVITDDHPAAGGVGYGKEGKANLSTLAFWMDAMQEAGVPGDDPAVQMALGFVKRLQNRTEGTEGQVFVVRGTGDGGFIYGLHRQGDAFVGESKAGSGQRGLRSYGSMTYAGFKSMLYANVARQDPRVQAAFEWIRRYWRLDSNPNMPELQSRQGLYYYYHVFAKALQAWGQDVIPDTKDLKHNWREELIDVLHAQQRDDGSWANEVGRWFETDPVLVTCYAVLALEEALKG
jgi:squalene-hopene/tetraprenyl-beta-curcumene cyclase